MDRTARQQIVATVEAERLRLADLFEDLAPHEWRVDSLCPGWTVHDVLAHLTLATRETAPAIFRKVLRARGDINRAFADAARDRAREAGPAELVAQLRETAASARRVPGAGVADPLVDVVVHGQDVVRPLGRVHEVAPDRVVPGLEHVWGNGFYVPKGRFDGVRCAAVDVGWSAGDGPDEVRGTATDLLLLLTGRTVALETLSGPGVDVLARAIAT